jgi:hypothetical protein
MKIGIINWKEGETDPFTVFSLTLREEFEKWGREVVIIPYAKEIGTHLPAARAQGLDFVVTWQGLGSRLRRDGAEVCLWDEWQLPLFCLHGDHPCQNPANHFAGSRYVRHFYSAASFTRYANRHFPRVHAGLTFKVPLLHRRQRAPELSGDFFVFAKNITEPTVTIERTAPKSCAAGFRRGRSSTRTRPSMKSWRPHRGSGWSPARGPTRTRSSTSCTTK